MSSRAASRPVRRIELADIVDLSHDGRGVARIDGKTVFIDDALPGERVEWVRLKRGGNFDEGRLERVLEASSERVQPQCAHYGVCGGCALQHLSSAGQIEFKQRQLLEALSRIGRVAPREVLPPLQAEVWKVRRRARLAARWVPKKHRTVVGFRERSTPYIADLRTCEVLAAPVDRLIESALAAGDRPELRIVCRRSRSPSPTTRQRSVVRRAIGRLTAKDRALLEQV